MLTEKEKDRDMSLEFEERRRKYYNVKTKYRESQNRIRYVTENDGHRKRC